MNYLFANSHISRLNTYQSRINYMTERGTCHGPPIIKIFKSSAKMRVLRVIKFKIYVGLILEEILVEICGPFLKFGGLEI
jgi:hypothetical protein